MEMVMALKTKTIMVVVAISSFAVILIAILAIEGYLSGRLLPIVGFCLLWSNYVFFRATLQNSGTIEDSHSTISWRFCAALGSAGIYFAGALWGLILFLTERQWYMIIGTVFSTAIGVFVLNVSRRLPRTISNDH
jgi:hypothetical protein